MPLSEEDVVALRADLERVQREEEATRADLERVQREKDAENREYEAKLERLRREKPLGTSFDGQGGGNSADRRGTAASTVGPMWTRGVSIDGGLGQRLPYVPRGIVPEFPVEWPPYVYIAWERRFEVSIANQGLRHTTSPDAPEIAVISCINDAYLFGHFGEALVTDHRRVWGYISEATAGAPLEDRLYECHSVSDALRTMREWSLPLQPTERHLLVAELERVQFMGDEDPKFFFARICRLETTMHAVGIKKSEANIVQIILRQLPERYDVVKIMTLADPQLTRQRLENTIRSAYSQRKAHEITKQWPAMCASAEPPYPHAFVVGHGFRDGGAVGGGGMPRQQQQLQQHWSRGGGMLRQQQQLQQHWRRATVACRGSSSSSNTGLVVVACRGSSSNSSNGLAAVEFLTSINVAPMLFLPPGRRNNSNRCSNRHGESLRSEVTGRTEVAPYLKFFSAVMTGLLRSGFSRKMWRCRCSACWRDRSSRRRRQWHLLQQHLRLKR